MKKFIEWARSCLGKVMKSKWAWVAVGIPAFLLVFSFSYSSVYKTFELKLYDQRIRMKPKIDIWPFLAMIDVNDNSITNIGQYPLPRSLYAQGLESTSLAGIKSGIFDIQFMNESPRLANNEMMRSLHEKINSHKVVKPEDIDKAVVDNDAVLASAIEKNPDTIMGFSFATEKIDPTSYQGQQRKSIIELFKEKASIPLPKGREKEFSECIESHFLDIETPIPALVKAANNFGYVVGDLDPDGATRKLRAIRVFDGRIYYSLALVSAMKICGVDKKDLDIRPGKSITIRNALNPVTLQRHDIVIPVNKACQFYVNWVGGFEKIFYQIPFYALLEYASKADDMHFVLDTLEAESGNLTRTELYNKRIDAETKYSQETEPSEKLKRWKDLSSIQLQIESIEKKLLSVQEAKRDAFVADFEKTKDPAVGEEAEKYKTTCAQLRLIQMVDGLRYRTGVIGMSAQAAADFGVTPFSGFYPMFASYPNTINTILQEKFIKKSPKWADVFVVFFCVFIMAYIIFRQSAKMSLVVMLGAIVISNTANIALFSFLRIWADQLSMNLAVILPSFTIIGFKLMSEESQKRFIKQAFGHYLSKDVIDDLIKNPEGLKLGGEEREMTVFFSDIKGFTSISEKLAPPELVTLLNEYLSEMTDVILANRGTVDKFIGDAIMAFYGAPQFFENHAQLACFAAIDMQNILKERRKKWKKEGYGEVYARFGINTGPAVVGNMGSRTRLDYTVMGDTVNLASRLEGVNKFYGTMMMISEMTYAQVENDVDVRYLDKITVKGKDQPIVVYELISRKGDLRGHQKELIEVYNHGIELFQKREWEKSRVVFKSALKINDEDGPSLKYIDRCSEFIKKPPSKNWNGVYKLTEK